MVVAGAVVAGVAVADAVVAGPVVGIGLNDQSSLNPLSPSLSKNRLRITLTHVWPWSSIKCPSS